MPDARFAILDPAAGISGDMVLGALIAAGAAIEVSYVHGHWRGVNDFEDFRSAVDFAHGQSPVGSAPGATTSDLTP